MPKEQNLVIVESPKKAQLIQGFLNKKKLSGFKVMASAGHVRDLKKRPLGVDIENNGLTTAKIKANSLVAGDTVRVKVVFSGSPYVFEGDIEIKAH